MSCAGIYQRLRAVRSHAVECSERHDPDCIGFGQLTDVEHGVVERQKAAHEEETAIKVAWLRPQDVSWQVPCQFHRTVVIDVTLRIGINEWSARVRVCHTEAEHEQKREAESKFQNHKQYPSNMNLWD